MALNRRTSVGYLTNLAGRLLVRELERHLAPLGLSPGHMPVLLALEDGSALTQKALTERAGVKQATMTATVTRMERDAAINALVLEQLTPDERDQFFDLITRIIAVLEAQDSEART